MATLEEFGRNMRALGDRVERRAPAIMRKVALDALRQVILGTPVGNKNIWLEPGKAPVGYVGGRARANWFVGIGSAPGTVTDAVDSSGSGALNAGSSVIAGYAGKSSIHLVNNLPYIIPLNNGHSHQAPIGFIEAAVQNAIRGLGFEKVTEEGK